MKPTYALRSFLFGSTIAALLSSPAAFAGNTWDGGGGSGFWNTDANWDLDTAPSTGVALTFAGNVQNSTSNDLAAVDPSFAGILFTNSGAVDNTSAFTLAGSRITLGGNITTTANTAGATITDIISLNMVLDGNRTITTNQQSATVQHNLTISGIITQDVEGRTLTKAGGANSALTLSGSNTYSGSTTISGGRLILSNLNAIQNSTSVSVATGSSLQLNVDNGTYGNTSAITLVGNGAPGGGNPGALSFGHGGLSTSTLNAPITLGGATTISSFGVNMNQTLGGAISGTGGLTIDSRGGALNHFATWTLNAASTYSGNTTIFNDDGLADATVKLGIANALPTTTSLNLQGGTNQAVAVFTTLDLNGFSQQLAGLTDTGSVQNNASNTVGKRVINSSGTLSTLTLNIASGTNTYGTTGTRVLAGTIGGKTAAGVDANTITLTKTGAGTLVLAGTNTYTGTTTASAGTLRFARQASLYNNTTASWTAANIQVAGTATLALNVGGTNEFTAGDVTTLLTNLGGANGTNTTGFAAGSRIGFDTTNAAGGTFTVADTISDSSGSGGGAIGLTKLGTNTLALSNSSTYTGTTTIAAGTLQISSGGSVGSGSYAGTISNAGTLRYSSSAAQTLSGAISGAGGVTKDTSDSSTLTLTNTNSYAGATTVSLGTLQFNGSLTGAGAAVGVSGGTLGVGAGSTISRNVNLSSGAVDLTGTVAGTLTVTGGTVTTSGTTPTVSIADFSAPGAGTVAASTPLIITSTLRMPSLTTATLTGGTSFTATGTNLANNSIASTLTLSGGTLSLLNSSVAAPAVALTNASFETDAGAANTYQYRNIPNTPITGWTNTTGLATWGIEQGTSNVFSGVSGVTGLPNYNASTNFKWAFMQGAQTVSQTFTAATDGYYTVGFADSGRAGSFGPLNVQVQLNGNAASSVFTPTQGAWTNRSSNSVFLTAGSHTLSFVFTNALGGDRSSTLDAVSVTGFTAGSLNLPATSIAATASSVLDMTLNTGTHNLAALNLTAGGTTTALSIKNGATLTLNGDASNNAISATGTAGQTASIVPNVTSPPSLIIASGKNVSVDTGVTLTVQSVISGGDVTKIGNGTLTLSGTNTYTGATTVSAGTLTLGNASALGSAAATLTGGSLDLGGQTITNTVSIGVSGTLTGNGGTGAATLAGTVTPGGSGSGLITMASASVASTSAIALQLAATGTRGVNYDALTISGVLALDGTITVSLNGLTPANGQSFDLIDSTGSIDVTNFTVATDLILPALGGGLVWDTSAFVATGIVSIVTAGGDPYTTWAGAAVFDEDDNNDGVDNGLAWLLGAGSPTENATHRLPVVTQSGGNLELSFTCLKLAGRGTAVLKLQYSKDLGITDLWANHAVSVPDAAGLVGSVTFTVPTVNGDPDLVDLKASIPASEAAPGTKLFGRLMGVR